MTAAATVLWTAAEVAAATAGECAGSWDVTGVSIDSRTVKAGDLFVALRGPTFDGHDYVAAAFAAGAAGAIVSAHPKAISATLEHRLVRVKDTFIALQTLGAAARARSTARIVAVTGSVGKTGTKDMLRTVLSAQGVTHATGGNLNNHWGVPLSLARMPRGTRYGVFELGMNHPGEIAPLSRAVRPHVAIVTAVEAVHLEFFDSVDGIAAEKASIAAGLDAGGTIILPADNPHIDTLRREAVRHGAARIITFGTDESADVRMVGYADGEIGQVVAEIGGERMTYDLGLRGRHWALNSLAALAAVAALGADIGRAAGNLAHVSPGAGRGAKHDIDVAGGAATLIDEAYNASPASVRALADALPAPVARTQGRRILVLGDMLELGNDGPALHAGLAPHLIGAGVDLVFTCGPLMEHLHAALPRTVRGGHARDSAAIAPLVAAALKAGDVVAVKGSHGSRMDKVVAALLARGRPAEPQRAANGG
ncbi:MAG: UDP-N-acetylmuramoylalanyl-D-glutamyl-2,6-diaminopimelate--D-alanyl-D-alanine ligase [Rhodospirillaceae bacterium]|nr:UDP-N-acetylmuramoylalanyl-D-glutamyl-2,6-diaminopimelate--D-alanyl-D-alanine ligase [Rhodospirillaceae bacterium]